MRQVNLLPLELQKQGRLILVRNIFIWAFVPLVVGVFVLHVAVVFWLGELERFVQNPFDKQELAEEQRLQQEIASMKASVRDLITQNPDQMKLFVVPLAATDILNQIGNAAEGKVWLTTFSMELSERSCEMTGESFTPRLVSEFMLYLRGLPYFKGLNLVSMEKKDPRQGEGILFKILCKLR